MAAVYYLKSFKEHEEHFLLLLQTQSLHPLVYTAVLGIGEWLWNWEMQKRTAFDADSEPWTKDTLWATWGITRISNATVLSQTEPPLIQLQCQLLRVLYHLLASQLDHASAELEKLSWQLETEFIQHGVVSADIVGVFWSYMILER